MQKLQVRVGTNPHSGDRYQVRKTRVRQMENSGLNPTKRNHCRTQVRHTKNLGFDSKQEKGNSEHGNLKKSSDRTSSKHSNFRSWTPSKFNQSQDNPNQDNTTMRSIKLGIRTNSHPGIGTDSQIWFKWTSSSSSSAYMSVLMLKFYFQSSFVVSTRFSSDLHEFLNLQLCASTNSIIWTPKYIGANNYEISKLNTRRSEVKSLIQQI